jgi:hypothetical protein
MIYKMRKLLVAVEEELHTLDSRLVGLMHESPAHSSRRARHWILLWSDICHELGVEVQLVRYLGGDFIAGDPITT